MANAVKLARILQKELKLGWAVTSDNHTEFDCGCYVQDNMFSICRKHKTQEHGTMLNSLLYDFYWSLCDGCTTPNKCQYLFSCDNRSCIQVMFLCPICADTASSQYARVRGEEENNSVCCSPACAAEYALTTTNPRKHVWYPHSQPKEPKHKKTKPSKHRRKPIVHISKSL